MGAAAVLVTAGLSIGVLLGPADIAPRPGEPMTRYAIRVWRQTSQAAEDLYVRALWLMPATQKLHQSDLTRRAQESTKHMTNKKTEEKDAAPDPLVLPVARSEVEIEQQQRLSVKRYVESVREAGEIDSAAAVVLPEQPDEVRQRMPLANRNGPELRCGQGIPAESQLTTRDIDIITRSFFQGSHGNQYGWKYEITFKNRGKETVQMLTRHWIFVDDAGNLETEVKGPGARGVTPVLRPSEQWSYESGTSLRTPYGSMQGSFQFEVLKGDRRAGMRSFSARVGRLALLSEGKSADIPCIDEASVGLLPATSVLSTERVIIGVNGAFRRRNTSKYYFSFDVQINNARDLPVDVVGHRWEVVDSKGERHVVANGLGVGGSFGDRSHFQLPAGDAFRHHGEIASPTPEANAEGTFRVVIVGDDYEKVEIEARTDFMGLSAKKSVTHVRNFVTDPQFL